MIDPLLREKIEKLDGSRKAGAIGKAAVRLEDLGNLMRLTDTLKSVKAAGSTPTKVEFDVLVDDVHAIHRTLMAVITEGLQPRFVK